MAKGVLESAETPTDSTLVVARASGAGEPQKHDTEVRADQGGEVAEGMRLDSHYPPGHQVIRVTFASSERLRKPA